MLSPTDMVSMFTTQKSSPVEFKVDLKRRRIVISFRHEFKAPPPEDTAYRSLFAEWQKKKKRDAKEQEQEIEEDSKQEREQLGQEDQEGSDREEKEESGEENQKKLDQEEQEESYREEQEEEDESDTEYEKIEEWERRETYRFEIRFEHLSTLLEESSEDINTRILSFSLPYPPEFYRRLHDTHRSFPEDQNARHWSERDTWFRQTVITYQKQSLDPLAITLRQPYAIIDIGMFTVLLPVTVPSSTDIFFVRSMDYLPVCVQVTTERSNSFQ